MAIQGSGPLYRLYAQSQAALATVLNTSGTWNSATAKLIPHNKITLTRNAPLISADYKTGTGSVQAGIAGGKRSGTFSGEIPFMPSGSAGTKPNCDPVLQNIFGAAPATSPGVSVTYTFTDGAGIPLTLALFNEAATTLTQQFLYGGVTKTFSLAVGGNGSLVLTFGGVAFYVLDSDNWANEDTTGKGGLTVSPTTEPASPALAGNIIPSFAASITFGGSAVAEFRSMNISGDTGRTLRMDGVGFYPDSNGVVQGRRKASLSSLKFTDSDGAALITVKNARFSKAPLDVIVTQGNVAGYIITHTIKGVQFGGCNFSEDGSGGVNVDFDDSPASASAIANLNEYSLVLT